MGKELIFSQMGMSTRASMLSESLMGKESTSGRTVPFTKENSKTVSNMEKVNGRSLPLLPNVTSLKDSTLLIRKMGKELSRGNLETYIMVLILTMKGKGMERCTGLTGLFIKVNGKKAFSMERES